MCSTLGCEHLGPSLNFVFSSRFIPLSSFYRLRNVLPLILVRTKKIQLVPPSLGTHAMNYALLKTFTRYASRVSSPIDSIQTLKFQSHSLDSAVHCVTLLLLLMHDERIIAQQH